MKVVGQPVDQFDEVDERAGVAVHEQQRRRGRARRAGMDEVQRLLVELGAEVRPGVQAVFDGAPVELVPPVGERVGEVVVRNAVRPVVARGGLGKAGAAEALGEVVELGLRDLDREFDHRHSVHDGDATSRCGTVRS
jgi:hypothetical protein